MQPSLGRHRPKAESQSSATVVQQDQITGRRNTRNFESKLGQAVDNMHGAGPAVARSQVCGVDSQAALHSQQKIVIVASMPERRHTGASNSNSTKVDGSGSKAKKQKKGQKAVVNKYQ